MDIRIKEKLKNQQGSSLAFVLIFGMIIMIMVASLLAVANSDFTFTQQTVESRQAYIDAKSVIEYGKIEINLREKKLSEAYNELMAAKNDTDRIGEIPGIELKIDDLKNQKTPIYGDANNAAGTLSFINDATKTQLGTVFVEGPAAAVNTTGTSQYIFKVETENLRRKLDYQVDFKYVVTTTPGTPGTVVTPTRPNLENLLNPNIGDSGWATTWITVPSWPIPSCTINDQATGNFENQTLTVDTHSIASKSNIFVDVFAWANEPTLNLIAKNICFGTPYTNNEKYGDFSIPIEKVYKAKFIITATGEGTLDEPTGQIRFKGNYIQNNNEKNTLKANNVIFDGDLNLVSSQSTLDITCDTLLVKGDVRVCYPVILQGRDDGSWSNLNIKANNIIVEGNVYVGSNSNLSVNCPNIWIDGNINTIYDKSKLEFSNVNYLETGNINLSFQSQFTVKGANANTSQVKVKSINPCISTVDNKTVKATEYKIKMDSLWSFSCTELMMNYYSSLELNSNIIKINGALTLGPQIINSEIKTRYFDCSGMTKIDDLKGTFSIKRIADVEPLYVRFGGGYNQTHMSQTDNSVNIGETDKKINKGATLVVFGPGISKVNVGSVPIIMGNAAQGYNKAYLNVVADDIWFDSTLITMVENRIGFWYQGGVDKDKNDFTNIHIGSNISFDGTVIKDSYKAVKCPNRGKEFPFMLKDSTKIPNYDPPVFPNPPGSTGSSSVTISPGTEKYY